MKAFPHTYDKIIDGHVATCTSYGMDLRDYFAAKAMQAFITLHENALVKDNFFCDWSKDGSSSEIVSLESYGIADAMMKAREQ
jgi:hypothetical protein